ncbi:hypothetical protein HG536_0C01340 [Torulaspora globosa]|uniref:Anaphase-promoting complex subunit 2 n=1 Tax=Torulaspora globosa TaxID=48254 RepID=A0A7G3ZEN0_9SACH|nr:uncharacterized protein HG536_0C01340 [Torulaspora globosa]QLL31966.1 hypothetical protein HG536_0C01340 [Torulaspora globosa]
MPECQTNEIGTLIGNIQEIVQRLHPGCDDELESLLTWLNPNEPNSNHHMRPPPLRLKDTIKLLVNQYYNGQYNPKSECEISKGLDFDLTNLLRQFYVHQVRYHFFTSFDSIQSFKDIQRLERYYDFPLKYIYLFQSNPDEWIMERDSLRHYLLNRNVKFKENLKQRLAVLIMEDDYEVIGEVLDWVNKACCNVSSTELLMDLIFLKITKYCESHLNGAFGERFLVMKTYNKFITKYWVHFTRLLCCHADDHELTNVIYSVFEKQFLRIRTKQAFQIFVTHYPSSEPTILEMRKLLTNSKQLRKIVVLFLLEFEARILNPSVTTVDALLAYVKCVKAFLALDPSGKYLHSISSFVRSRFQERSDLVTVLLYAIMDLGFSELLEGPHAQVNAASLEALAEEFKKSELAIDYDLSFASGNRNAVADNVSDEGSLPYEEVMEQFLSWTPDSSIILPHSPGKRLSSHGLLDILLELFESKDFFISEFLKLQTKRLLSLKYYRLDKNWSNCLQILKKKLSNGTSATSIGITPSGNPSENARTEDYSNINYIDVMLWDVKCSLEVCQQMHQVSGLDPRIYPKFISYLYWNYHWDTGHSFELPQGLEQELEKYCKVYSEMRPGRALKLCRDRGVVELELAFQDGRRKCLDVTLEQYAVIQQFDADQKSPKHTAEDISARLKMEPSKAKSVLRFWVEKGILLLENGYYVIQESKQGGESETPHNVASGSGSLSSLAERPDSTRDQENQVSNILKNVWPFIQGMLMNLGSLKVEKIHSFLKATAPKELGYSAITQSHLDFYLSLLVEEERLECTSNGSYKLRS